MKICRRCQRPLPMNAFYVHAKMADGHLNICKECVRLRMRRHRKTAAGREMDRRNYERKKRNGRIRAQYMVKNAIRDGRMSRQPCEVCGAPNAQAHHMDYSKPLEVRWLCSAHHGIEHRIQAYA